MAEDTLPLEEDDDADDYDDYGLLLCGCCDCCGCICWDYDEDYEDELDVPYGRN